MLSAVCLGSMSVGKVACRADPAVLLAALDDLATDAAPTRVELAAAWVVRVVAVAAVLVLVDLALKHIVGSFERGELGAPVLELDPKLAKSCSCRGSSLTQDGPLAADASGPPGTATIT